MQVLERAECERRLARGGVGRLAVAGRRSSDPPAIRPVNFAFDGSRVVIRTGDGVLREGARRSAAAEFEIDEIADADHSGWSVIVSGRLSELDAPETDSGQGRARVRPWAPGDRPYTLALSSDSITGRWIGVVPAAPAPIDVDDAAHDAWGRSEETRSRVRRVVEPFYRRWFRFRWDGLERIPTTGGVLLVANHAGAVPVDGMLLMHGIEREI